TRDHRERGAPAHRSGNRRHAAARPGELRVVRVAAGAARARRALPGPSRRRSRDRTPRATADARRHLRRAGSHARALDLGAGVNATMLVVLAHGEAPERLLAALAGRLGARPTVSVEPTPWGSMLLADAPHPRSARWLVPGRPH